MNCPGCAQRMEQANGCAPDCPSCGGFIKTATVSFGQAMPDTAMQRAQTLAQSCDLFLGIGSSLLVWPAAGFPLVAKRRGAPRDHHQPGADRIRCNRRPGRASGYRHRARALHRPLNERNRSALCTGHDAFNRSVDIFVLSPRIAGVIFVSRDLRCARWAPAKSGGLGVMASDGIEPKSNGPGSRTRCRSSARRLRTVVEVAGVIKWFDVAKGYGFIIPDNGMTDVLLHVTCLRRDGYQTAYEGARIRLRGGAGAQGPAGLPRSLHGRVYGDPSGADAAAANPRHRLRRPAAWSGRRSNGSTGSAVSASSRVARAHPTFSSISRRCAASG